MPAAITLLERALAIAPEEARAGVAVDLVAALVGATSSAILASIGLEVLGLGSVEAPTLGMTLYWVNYNAAIINGWWWWWVACFAFSFP